MKSRRIVIGASIIGLIILALGMILVFKSDIAVLNPKGTIASQQRNLILTTTLLSLVVVLPVFALTIGIALKYRAGNTKANYTPEWDHHRGLETLWWGIPIAIILLLAVITWKTTHDLDPYKPIYAAKKPIKVQVVALEWKWLFIYPDQDIASVNLLRIPEDTPIDFEITADAPMNSFWIPQLGGQVYAMAGMTTKLHLMADQPGTYQGVSANLSGEGFSGMRFTTESTSSADFDTWVREAKVSPNMLSADEYEQIAHPSKNVVPATYWSVESGLYDKIIMKYMEPKAPESGEIKNNDPHSHADEQHHH